MFNLCFCNAQEMLARCTTHSRVRVMPVLPACICQTYHEHASYMPHLYNFVCNSYVRGMILKRCRHACKVNAVDLRVRVSCRLWVFDLWIVRHKILAAKFEKGTHDTFPALIRRRMQCGNSYHNWRNFQSVVSAGIRDVVSVLDLMSSEGWSRPYDG